MSKFSEILSYQFFFYSGGSIITKTIICVDLYPQYLHLTSIQTFSVSHGMAVPGAFRQCLCFPQPFCSEIYSYALAWETQLHHLDVFSSYSHSIGFLGWFLNTSVSSRVRGRVHTAAQIKLTDDSTFSRPPLLHSPGADIQPTIIRW
jgi:hypothetical protein